MDLSVLLEVEVFTAYQKWDIVAQVFGSIVTVLAAYLAFRFAQQNMQKETQIRVSQYKNERFLEAAVGFWKLLAYTSDVENGNSVVTFRRDKTSGKDTFYFNRSNGEEFIKTLSKTNYEHGHGLFLSLRGRELFYEYRNLVYGFLLRNRESEENVIEIENQDLARGLFKLHNDLVVRLREELKLERPSLLD
jgi:hypothetical protein